MSLAFQKLDWIESKGIRYKTPELAVTDVEIAKTVTSF